MKVALLSRLFRDLRLWRLRYKCYNALRMIEQGNKQLEAVNREVKELASE